MKKDLSQRGKRSIKKLIELRSQKRRGSNKTSSNEHADPEGGHQKAAPSPPETQVDLPSAHDWRTTDEQEIAKRRARAM